MAWKVEFGGRGGLPSHGEVCESHSLQALQVHALVVERTGGGSGARLDRPGQDIRQSGADSDPWRRCALPGRGRNRDRPVRRQTGHRSHAWREQG